MADPGHDGRPVSSAELQRSLQASGASALAKYQDLFVGSRGLWRLFLYDTLSLASGVPGAAGFALRKLCFRPLLGGLGRGSVFGRNVVLRHPRKIFIGENVVIDDNVVLDAKGSGNEGITLGDGSMVSRNSILSCKGGNIALGRGSKIGINCLVHSESRVEIAPDVTVAAYCYLLAGGNHEFDRIDLPVLDQPSYHKGGVMIGAGSWLAARVTVLDGVSIGRGVVVGAGAVVRDSLPDYAIAVGIPARVIRLRGTPSPAKPEPGPHDACG
jgi:acetyltransferase-like isoleucine patch superfamily enzyme